MGAQPRWSLDCYDILAIVGGIAACILVVTSVIAPVLNGLLR